MKKSFMAILVLLALLPLYAGTNKYFKNQKLVNTMYVDSLEGLRVRNEPSLSAKRVCGLPNALPVKIIEVGKETKIDGIKDNWVKILLPAYEWKGENPEYGWVFGGYLSEEKVKYDLNSPADVKNLLASKIWREEGSSFIKEFRQDGIFAFCKLAAGGGDTGEYSIKNVNQLTIRGKFYDEYGVSDEYTVTYKLKIISENRIQIDGKYYEPYIDAMSYRLDEDANIRNFVYGDYSGKSIYEAIFLENPYSHTYTEEEKAKVAGILIKYGVDAKGTPYEKQYDEYWSAICSQR